MNGMSYRQQLRAEVNASLLAFLKEMVELGYRSFINTTEGSTYAMVQLKNEVMSIQYDMMGGWHYSNNYIPSTGNGSGCRCNDIKTNDLSYNTMLQHLHGCSAYARRLGAKPYANAEVALKDLLKRYGTQYKEVTLDDN